MGDDGEQVSDRRAPGSERVTRSDHRFFRVALRLWAGMSGPTIGGGLGSRMPALVLDGGEIRPMGGGPVWARWSGVNILGGEPVPRGGDAALALWSGWVEDEDGQRDPRTWGAAGWEALGRRLDALVAEHAGEILVRTHHAHAVSDVPSSLRLLRAREGRPGVRLIVDVGAMIAPSMLSAAEDHAARILESLAGVEGVAAVVASSPREGGEPGPLGGGALAGEIIARLIRRLVPPRVPLILLGPDGGGGLLAGLPHVS